MQVELTESSEAAADAAYSAQLNPEGVGELTVGVSRADGTKCTRCWNYSVQVRV